MLNKCLHLRFRKKQGKTYCYCTKKHAVIESFDCSGCSNKEYKQMPKKAFKTENNVHQKTTLNKISKTNKIVKATSISKSIKLKVWERDKHRCIFCHKPVSWNYANSHFIKRSHLGLGIEENMFTACPTCHHDFDDTPKREFLLPFVKRYLMNKYDYWNEDILIYKKWRN